MMTINFHGVRGSHPTADVAMAAYGGNTSCVEVVKVNGQGIKVPLIIDAGSGLIKLGYAIGSKLLTNEYSKTFTMLFTHLHPDHTEGFNFFVPNFSPFCKICILGMETLRENVGAVLKGKMMPPTFPIEYKDLKSLRRHGVLSDGQRFHISQEGLPVSIAKEPDPLFEVQVMQAYAPSHPQQGALYYKIRDPEDNTTLACIWDIESHIGGDVRVISFAADADVMIHDTQYTEEEYASPTQPVQGFGHSTYAMAIENAKKARVKYLIPFHYNPRHNDTLLDSMKTKYAENLRDLTMLMSYEGLSITFKEGDILHQDSFLSGFSK
ncbi:MAG: MBL fold metallo-hydrolase [Treponema sp.]|jgi:ribonuclease BN (tRNA processing enzyme)|nr:MBL fold metallo-hydrolase [Treponema sp.]